MPEVTGQSKRAGVAMFSAIFVMIIVGLLAMQFHYMTRQAQSTAFRFQTSELARQLAAAAIEEAFMYVHNETENQSGALFNKLVSRSSELDASNTGLDNKNSKGVPVPVVLTQAQAAAMPIGSRLKIDATARIVDFRNTDSTGARYYENEGVGTLELRVTVEPKPEFKKQLQGACTITRHHDYKIVSIVSRRDNNTQRTSYTNSYILDYALFVRDGQEEFASTYSHGFNSQNRMLAIDQTSLSADKYGKIYLGNRRGSHVFINLDSERKEMIPEPQKVEKIYEATDLETIEIIPALKKYIEAETSKLADQQGGDLESFKMSGQKAYFEYERYPMADEAYAANAELKGSRDLTRKGELKVAGQTEPPIVPAGIKFLPVNALDKIIEGDVRQRYFHYGYFFVDLSNCRLDLEISDEDFTIHLGDPELVEKFKNRRMPCFNFDHHGEINPDMMKLGYIKNNIANRFPEVLCRTDIENRYLKGLNTALPHPAMFHFRNAGSLDDPTMASVPFAHMNLWARRNAPTDRLEEYGIYQPAQKKLFLRGVIELSEPLVIGENGDVEYEGLGVIIAPGITIKNGLKRKPGTNSACILVTRGHPIEVSTENLVEAALVSMGRNDRNGQIIATRKMNLHGCIATDRLKLDKWAPGVEHRVAYDPFFKRNDDLYQVNIARWVTFERMVEQDE
ncbi:MAG TPA: hypothetical protein PLK28_07160 [Candidatus Rifleibacterium sp.]|nr:hypothetical protein [Candidatus Rifleibacterium sp.]